MQPLNTCGIYAITCTVTGKAYIGSAVNIPQRWAVHKHLLGQGKHHSPHLQRAWDKYGAQAFVFSILEVIESDNDLVTAEQKWMDAYQSYDDRYGYNICRTAGSTLGREMSDKAKAALLAANLGRPLSAEHRAKMSARRLGKPLSEKTKARVSAALKGKPKSAEAVARQSKSWVVVDPGGNEQPVHNLKAFCREHRLDASHMVKVAKGQWKQHNGWKCRYAEEAGGR